MTNQFHPVLSPPTKYLLVQEPIKLRLKSLIWNAYSITIIFPTNHAPISQVLLVAIIYISPKRNETFVYFLYINGKFSKNGISSQ